MASANNMEDIIAVRGQLKNSWVYTFKGYTFHCIKQNDTEKEPKEEHLPAPPGKYRCKFHRKGCPVTLHKISNTKINVKGSHLDAIDINLEMKRKLNKKIDEEARKSLESNSIVANKVKMGSEFKNVIPAVMHSTLESRVRNIRKKLNKAEEPNDWTGFVQSAKHLRHGQSIFLEKIEDMEDNALFFGKKDCFKRLDSAEKIHMQFLRKIKTNFRFNMCMIHIVESNKTCFPVMCVLYKNETYESLRAIMFAILSRAPAMKNVNQITTELTEMVIKVVRLCFQLAKIKCTWYYYIQETSQAWIKLKLPFDVESIYEDENKLLRYTWALPLALQHQKAEEFNDIITILNDLQDLPNDSDIFMDTLDEKWKTRIKYILPYPMNEYTDMLEIAERKLAIDFLTGKKTILGILQKLENIFSKPYNYLTLLNKAAKKMINDAGIQTSYNLEKFLEKALTEDAVVRITSKIIMEQPCNMHVSATAGLNDLECAHTDDIENEPIPALYKRVHLKGPIDNSQKKNKRLEVIENILNEVVNETDVSSDNDDMSMFEGSPYFDSDSTRDDHYDEPLQEVSLSTMKQKTNIEQEISLTSSSKKVKDTSSFTLEKQLLQSEIVICDTETTIFNDKISKPNFFTLDNDNNHQEDCSVSDPLDINLPKPKSPQIISSKILAKNLLIDKSNQRKDKENCDTLRTRRARESKTSKWLDDFIILEDRKKKREKNKENNKESDEIVEKRKCT